MSTKYNDVIIGNGAGGLIAFEQIEYGIAAIDVGPLQTWAGLGLNVIYGGSYITTTMVFADGGIMHNSRGL